MTDGANEAAMWGASTDAVSTTDENSYVATDGCLVHATNSATLDAKASLDSFGSDDYTLDWTTADGSAREFGAVLFGSEPTAPTEKQTSFYRRTRMARR